MMVFHMRARTMRALVDMRTVGRSRGGRHARVSLLEVEGQLMLLGQVWVARNRPTLRRDGWHTTRLLEHRLEVFLFVSLRNIPCRRRLVGRGDASGRRIRLVLCNFSTFLLHPLDWVELIIDGRAFRG
jgi:hypothetical protein